MKALYLKKGTGENSVFGVSDNVKNAFASACRAAGVEGFRLHDCRHTAITRMIQAGMTPMQVMKISGHTQMSTAIDSFHAASL